jgi:hypothetical protein
VVWGRKQGRNDGKQERRVGGVLGIGSNNTGFDRNVHCNDKEKKVIIVAY